MKHVLLTHGPPTQWILHISGDQEARQLSILVLESWLDTTNSKISVRGDTVTCLSTFTDQVIIGHILDELRNQSSNHKLIRVTISSEVRKDESVPNA